MRRCNRGIIRLCAGIGDRCSAKHTQANSALLELHLSDNNVEDAGAVALAEAFEGDGCDTAVMSFAWARSCASEAGSKSNLMRRVTIVVLFTVARFLLPGMNSTPRCPAQMCRGKVFG